jgi:hypothetical protein
MRELECGCGRHLEGDDEQHLIVKVLLHLEADHPEIVEPTIELAKELVAAKAYGKRTPDPPSGKSSKALETKGQGETLPEPPARVFTPPQRDAPSSSLASRALSRTCRVSLHPPATTPPAPKLQATLGTA